MKKIKLSRRTSFQAPTPKRSRGDRGRALEVVLLWKLHRCSAFPSRGQKQQVGSAATAPNAAPAPLGGPGHSAGAHA